MGWGKRMAIAGAVVVALGGGYVAADAYDVVPGWLTTKAPYPQASPFPTPPGAATAAPLAPALTPVGSDGPVPNAATVQAGVNKLVADPRVGPASSVLVTDLATGQVLGSSAADTGRIPASSQKLLTAAAALSTIGPEKTLPTTAILKGTDLYLVGGGDMMLAAGVGNAAAVNGRAGLGDLAKQAATKLKAAGTTQVTVHVDDTLFTGPAISPTWDPGNVPAGYAAPVTALAVNIARLGPEEYAKRSPDPSMAAAATFAEQLKAHGIAAATTATRAKAPTDGTKVGEVHSAPMREVVDYLLQHSDNTITEVVGRLVAVHAGQPGSFDGATAAVLAAVAKLGVDVTGAKLADCSGLGDGSSLTPRQLTQVIQILGNPTRPTLRWGAVGLPIAGLRGTLDDRFLTNAGRGVVRAKTGSLPGVTALAGTVVTDDERVLAFAVLADEIPKGGALRAHSAIDDFVGSLAECGCH